MNFRTSETQLASIGLRANARARDDQIHFLSRGAVGNAPVISTP
jgi:hypothetical protein